MKNVRYHILAIVTSCIWGSTFISSKMLISAGLQPAEIMILRFIMAYICILPFSIKLSTGPKRKVSGLFADNLKDEIGMALLGITGGSMYFLLENTALEYTQASNVAIIIATTPILTALAARIFIHNERSSMLYYFFSMISLIGVAIVVFNGEFILKLNPLGDILTIGAAALWAIYSVIILRLSSYPSAMITRKIFIYGILTMLPYFIFRPATMTAEMLCRADVLWNLVFLGTVASFGCFFAWNVVIEKIGAVTASTYLYLNPIAATLIAVPVLGEKINILTISGAILIIGGMYFAQKFHKPKNQGLMD